MQSSLTRLVPIALALLGASAGCSVRQSHAEMAREAPPIAVDTVVAGTRPVARTITLTGTLLARRESAVAADVGGKVQWVGIERGDTVKRGTALARLDPRGAALVEAEATAQAAAASQQSRLADVECARAERLYTAGAINRADYDRSVTQCEASRHQAAAANARRRLADKNLGDAVVKAPFAGVVAERLVNEGEFVPAGARIASIVDIDSLRVELSVPETVIASLQPGAQVAFQVASFPGETFKAKVQYIGAAVRRQSRDLIVEAALANPGRRLRPGMFAVAQVTVGENPLPVIPATALREADGTQRIFVVLQGRLQERLVRTAGRLGDEWAVISGLQAGERVVRAPQPQHRDGLAVR